MKVKQVQFRFGSSTTGTETSEASGDQDAARTASQRGAAQIAWKSRVIVSLVLGMAAAELVITGYQSRQQPLAIAGAAAPVRVQTITVTNQTLLQTIEMPVTVEGLETADLYAKVGGYLAEISVDIGDQLTKGQVVARLSIPEMSMEFERQQAGVERARA